jgi:hypothetical protein
VADVSVPVGPTVGLAAADAVGSQWVRPDRRRVLQLALAAVWLLDGVLQLQAAFFDSSFGKTMIGSMAQGNPTVIASPITWASRIIRDNPTWTNAIFAAIQISLGILIALRPTLKVGLASSVVWALGVWWVGEGLGGVLSGSADTASGAPGAVIIYALIAVLLWPSDPEVNAGTAEASRLVGTRVANALWLILWGSLSFFAVAGANRAAQALSGLVSGEATGEPGWIQWIDKNAAAALSQRGLTYSVILAVLCAVVAVGVYLPRGAADALIALGALVGLVVWVVGEDFGTLFTNGATDVNSGPLLILLSLVYWRPLSPAATPALASPSGGGV